MILICLLENQETKQVPIQTIIYDNDEGKAYTYTVAQDPNGSPILIRLYLETEEQRIEGRILQMQMMQVNPNKEEIRNA